MDFDSYRKIYKNFEFSTYQTLVMTLVAQEVMKDWPQTLPGHIKKPLKTALKEVSGLWRSRLDGVISSEEMSAAMDLKLKEWDQAGRRRLFGNVLLMYWSRPDPSSREIDFNRILYSQTLIMLFAHLDAFLADSLRAICHVRPEILKCDKKIEWADILACGSWEKLVDELIEQYVFVFGWKPIADRVEFLKDRLGLPLTISGDDLKLIDSHEKIRNAVIHNGGNASLEYLERSGRSDLALGQAIPIEERMIKDSFQSVHGLAKDLANTVAKKFYNKDDRIWF